MDDSEGILFTRQWPWESRLPLSFPDPLRFPTRGFPLGPSACFARTHNVAYASVVPHQPHSHHYTCDDVHCTPPHNESAVGAAGLAADEQPGTAWVDVDSESLTPAVSPTEENDDRW